MKRTHIWTYVGFTIMALFCIVEPTRSDADEGLSLSGLFDLRGVAAMDPDSVHEDPSLFGRVKLDTPVSAWQFHAWLEGGWDGSVKPANHHAIVKNYDEVYQSNTPYFEFKELSIARSLNDLDIRAGIQRFAWGRLDEYPLNDLLNPWDYSQFLRKPLEDRKIGVPSLSASRAKGNWTYETVWVPWLVPYRLPLPDERWAGSSLASSIAQAVPHVDIVPQEPDLPAHTIANSSVGLRLKHIGDVEWAINLFHGYDPRPVFKTTALLIVPMPGSLVIDPGYVPDFHKISVMGGDAALVLGDLSIRAEAAFTANRFLNVRHELWGYPATPTPGVHQLALIGIKRDTLEYGIGADYRLFEDSLLTVQVQQSLILGSVDLLFEHKVETIVWANMKAGWLNQKIETYLSIAYNPEHDDRMAKANAWYVFNDAWKAGVTAVAFTGPAQSTFGRFARNDQIEAELVYAW